MIVLGPSTPRFMTERRERPIRRWISWVRPLGPPLSLELRVWVALGSMPYSPVTHPFPEGPRQSGTSSRTEAAQRTRVFPVDIRQDPSA